MRKTRPGWVPPRSRGDGVHTTGQMPPVAVCRFSTASPIPRPNFHLSEAHLDETFRRFTHVHPSGLPLARRSGMDPGPLRLLPLSFAPRRYQRRTSRWGRAIEHKPGLRHRQHRRPPFNAPLDACDLVSHHLRDALRRGRIVSVRSSILPLRQGISPLRPTHGLIRIGASRHRAGGVYRVEQSDAVSRQRIAW